jgi:hypothetical protein
VLSHEVFPFSESPSLKVQKTVKSEFGLRVNIGFVSQKLIDLGLHKDNM